MWVRALPIQAHINSVTQTDLVRVSPSASESHEVKARRSHCMH